GDLNSLNVHAAIGAGEGSLALNGKLFIDDEQPRYDLNLTGSNFPLVRIPEAEVDVSPELQLVGNAKSIEITGAVLVPRILVDVKRLPNSAVSVSEDQVMVGGNGSAGEAQRNDSFLTDKVSGDVAIRLGDDISINGFGITSKLSGGLQWTKQLGHALGRANGAIKIDNGVFKAYGQNMVIENGRLEFAGPIGNPGLAIQAVRPDIPVKAGINVTGTVRTPEISLFSSPPLTDGNTLSYIVTGREIGEASAGDAGVLTQAALSLGVEQSTVVRNQIRNIFGLDELSVAAGETARDTSLVAGKRLSPKLSVRTGFNPFDQLWSFFLNYKLTPRWSIEAESGERQGADLLYSIEGERLLDVLRLD
ncbi:MAG: translocation and assembly module TamB, partial [Gammaproteobacteria bacterium]